MSLLPPLLAADAVDCFCEGGRGMNGAASACLRAMITGGEWTAKWQLLYRFPVVVFQPGQFFVRSF